jgi:hypothetical protein
MRPGPSWGKKDKHCDPSDPGDRERGSYWDHVLIGADSRLIVSLVVGRRETETARQAFADFYRRTDGDLTPLITSDEYAPYRTVIVETYGVRKEELELTEEQKVEYDYEGMPGGDAIRLPVFRRRSAVVEDCHAVGWMGTRGR